MAEHRTIQTLADFLEHCFNHKVDVIRTPDPARPHRHDDVLRLWHSGIVFMTMEDASKWTPRELRRAAAVVIARSRIDWRHGYKA